jgi:hypothetical protein
MLCLGAVLLIIFSVLQQEIRMHTGLGPTSSDIPVYVSVIGFLLGLVVQHTLPRTRAGFYIGVAAMIGGLIYVCFAPREDYVSNWSDFGAGKTVTVDFQPGWDGKIEWNNVNYNGYASQVPQASAPLTPVEQPTGSEIWISGVFSTFDTRDYSGGLFPPSYYFYNSYAYNAEAIELVQAQLPGIKVTGDSVPARPPRNVGLFSLTPDLEKQTKDKTGRLTLRVSGQVLSLRQIAAIPLDQPHYIARVSGGIVRVKPIASGHAQLTLWSVAPQSMPFSGTEDFVCVLVDPQARTGKVLRRDGFSSTSSGFTFTSRSRSLMDAESSYALDGNEALGSMILYVFQYTPTADFNTTLVAPNFKMSPPAN